MVHVVHVVHEHQLHHVDQGFWNRPSSADRPPCLAPGGEMRGLPVIWSPWPVGGRGSNGLRGAGGAGIMGCVSALVRGGPHSTYG